MHRKNSHGHRLEDTIKMCLNGLRRSTLDSNGSGQDQAADFCEHSISNITKGIVYHDQLNDCQLFRKQYAPWS